MMNTKHKHSHIPLLILAISVTLVVIALYVYMYNATGNAVASAIAARDVVATERNDQSQAKKLMDIASSTTNDRYKISTLFISPEDIVSFITTLEALGPQAGSKVTITSIDADPMLNAAVGATGKAHAHIDASGSWGSVMTTISLAERLPYASTISHLRLSQGSTDNKHTWNVSFDVQVLLLVSTTTPQK